MKREVQKSVRQFARIEKARKQQPDEFKHTAPLLPLPISQHREPIKPLCSSKKAKQVRCLLQEVTLSSPLRSFEQKPILRKVDPQDLICLPAFSVSSTDQVSGNKFLTSSTEVESTSVSPSGSWTYINEETKQQATIDEEHATADLYLDGLLAAPSLVFKEKPRHSVSCREAVANFARGDSISLVEPQNICQNAFNI